MGVARLIVNGETLAETDLLAADDVAKLDLTDALRIVLARWPAPCRSVCG